MKVIASVLNVRSGPGTDFRVLGQLQEGANVSEPQETHGDWAWIYLEDDPEKCGWVHAAYLHADTPAVISGLQPPAPERIEAVFGKPCYPECSAGRVQLPAPLKLGWAAGSVTRVACHVLMVPIFTAVFNAIHQAGLWDRLKTFDGIYNCRNIKGATSVSTHSWGISVDLNASSNRQGTDGDMDPEIVKIFEAHGFYWGGWFQGKRRDEMHFEFVKR